jgi:hypothetical protein
MVREAARLERIDVHEATDTSSAIELLRSDESAVVVVEDVPAGLAVDVARAAAARDPEHQRGPGVVTVGSARPPAGPDGAMTDWLVWPSTLGYVRTKLRAWLLRRACRWQNAPLPADEEVRLESLRALAVLDTAPEARFDSITRHASAALEVPVALVSLIDADRQWFKSKVGIGIDETPRDMALCAHAILGDDVLQVPDTLADDRFADNPLVAHDPRVRFYAGAPLTLADGTKAGTLCVIDYRPRVLDASQLAELRRLADMVTNELESR